MRKHLSFFLDQAGGILDPKAQLSIGDVGGAGGIGKIMDVMGSAGKQAKKNNKNPKGPKGKGEEGDVVQAMSNNGVYMYIGLMCMFPLAGTAWDSLGQSSISVDKSLEQSEWMQVRAPLFQYFMGLTPNPCLPRTQAFRLQPLQMSQDLIAQLQACAVKLEGTANALQSCIKKRKNKKNKHYKDIIVEVWGLFWWISSVILPPGRPTSWWLWAKSAWNFPAHWWGLQRSRPNLPVPRPLLRQRPAPRSSPERVRPNRPRKHAGLFEV